MSATNIYEIPVVDFSAFREGDAADRQAVAARVGAAAQTYGFMSLVGHGIPQETISGALRAAADFFGEPVEKKLLTRERENNRGYLPMFDRPTFGSDSPTQSPPGQEAFSMGHPDRPNDPALFDLPFYAETPWPEFPGFRERLTACYRAMYALSRQVLQSMAVHLGKPVDFFDRVSGNTYSNMRVIHYPPIETIAHITDIGVRPHEDQGLITLLIQDMNGGLSVLGPDNHWLPVIPNEKAVVINVAKLMTRWTNGRFRSAVHTVVNRSGKERYSMPLFVHPDYYQRIDPRDFAAPGEELRFDPIVAGEQVYANFTKKPVGWKSGAQPAATV